MKVYTLSYCSLCKELLQELSNKGILYSDIDADQNDQEATRLEDLINTTRYPIVHISKPEKDIYLAAESSFHNMDGGTIQIYTYDSIPHLVKLIQILK